MHLILIKYNTYFIYQQMGFCYIKNIYKYIYEYLKKHFSRGIYIYDYYEIILYIKF